MASESRNIRILTLDDLLAGSPSYWLAVFVLAMPWLRFELGPWVLYPGHLAVGALLAAVMWEQGGWGVLLRPLAPGLALGGYLALMLVLRGQFVAAGVLLLVTGLHFAWATAAFRMAYRGEGARSAQAGLLILLALSLAAGLGQWAVLGFWPGGCGFLGCGARTHWPYPFTGGWPGAASYLVFLLFLLPVLGAPLIAALRSPAGGRARGVLAGLTAAAGLGLVAGGSWWELLVAMAGWVLLAGMLTPARWDGDRLLLRGLAFGFGFAVVLVYGLAPGYLGRMVSQRVVPPAVRIALPDSPPPILSSEESQPLTLSLVNTGSRTLGGNGDGPLRVGARLMVTPERGATRLHDMAGVPVPLALEPGKTVAVQFPLRLPHWVKEGYLAWRVLDGEGQALPMAPNSHPGFRFVNAGFRRLGLDPENRLSALAQRARDFQRETFPAAGVESRADRIGMVLGDLLDTLFFSPLWGEMRAEGEAGSPLGATRPLWPELFHRYGLIGLLLGGWLAWRLVRGAAEVEARSGGGEALAWRLTSLAVPLVAATGLFSPAAGSYHGFWALFLLAGYVEGRRARLHPRAASSPAAGLLRRIRIPRPWRMGAPSKGAAGRARKR